MKPVFVGGCERSGTTMLGSMLGAHPDYLCPPEMQFKLKLLREGHGRKLINRDQVRSIVSGDLKAELQGWRIHDQQLDFAATSSATAILEIVRSYGSQHGQSDPKAWIDHTPENIRWAATLAEEFSGSTFIHIVRDGRGVAASLMNLDWGPNNIYRAAHHWLEGISFGLAAESALGVRCVRVHFEDLVRQPEATLRRLCNAAGLEYHPAMTSGGGYSVNEYSSRQHALVGSPPAEERMSAWEHDLSPREIEIFEAIVADQLPLLGYETRFGIAATPANRSERWSGEFSDRFKGRVVNRFRKRSRIKAGRRAAS